MALYKRTAGGAWWVKFSSGGKVIRRSSGSTDRKFAEEFETTLRARFLRQEKLGEVVRTWKEATTRYVKEAEWRPSTRAMNEYALTFFTPLDNLPLGEFNVGTVSAARDFVERTQSRVSANRIMAVFKSVLRRCVKWGWLKYAPPVEIPSVPKRDIVPLTPDELSRLLKELPEHLRGPAKFSVLTGLREANVTGLTWSQVDLVAGRVTIPSSHYKTKRVYSATLSASAIEVLKAQPRVSNYVFTFDEEPVTRFNNHAFRKARIRAGLPHLRWHDLRHTFVSWLAQAGANDRVLQQAGGWTSSRMVENYAHLRGDDLLKYVDAVGTKLDTGVSESVGSETTQATEKQVVPSI